MTNEQQEHEAWAERFAVALRGGDLRAYVNQNIPPSTSNGGNYA
jgi:hypothetical protein